MPASTPTLFLSDDVVTLGVHMDNVCRIDGSRSDYGNNTNSFLTSMELTPAGGAGAAYYATSSAENTPFQTSTPYAAGQMIYSLVPTNFNTYNTDITPPLPAVSTVPLCDKSVAAALCHIMIHGFKREEKLAFVNAISPSPGLPSAYHVVITFILCREIHLWTVVMKTYLDKERGSPHRDRQF